MALAIDWPRAPDTGHGTRSWRLPRFGKADAALEDVLAKSDDRLLVDAGLTREAVLGPEAHFWREWLRIKEPWTL
jgi:hypothetical protein